VEGGWTPPVRVCGVKANVAALALSWRGAAARGWSPLVRASIVTGALRAPITCGEEDVSDPADQTCFEGMVSDDRIAPLTLTGEAGIARRGGRIEPYAIAGISSHRMHFDVNYDRLDTSPPNVYPPLSDHNRFGATLARFHIAAGAALSNVGPLRLGGEVYFSPASLLTVRARAAYQIGPRS